MAKFERPEEDKGKGKGKGKSERVIAGGTSDVYVVGREGLIEEPSCKVCQSEHRLRIDHLLAVKTKYTELERVFDIPYRSFSNHAKKHLRIEDEAIKANLEYEAGLMGETLEAGVRGVFLRRSVMDISIQKYFEAVTKGEISPEAGDVIKMIELREKFEENTAVKQIEQYELQFNAFKEAIELVCPPEMMTKILDVVREKLQVVDRPALQPPEDTA